MTRIGFLCEVGRRFAALLLGLGVCVTVVSGSDQLEVVTLPPAGPGAVLLFGDDLIPPLDPSDDAPDFGAVVPAGDVDGDGMDDLFTVVYADFPWTGATVFLVFGEPHLRQGQLVRDPSPGVTRIRHATHALIRPAVAGAGDLDGDGFADFLISAPAWSMEERRWTSHEIYLIYGSPELRDTEVLLPPEDARTLTWRSAETLEGHATGAFGLLAAGDLDGDGIPEVAFGASRHHDNDGRVYVASLDPSLPAEGMDLEQIGISLPGYVLEGVSVGDEVTSRYGGDRAGFWLESAGDLNGDGMDDLYIGYARAQADIVFGSRDLPARLRLDDLGRRGMRLAGPPSGPTVQEFSFFSNPVFPGDLDGDRRDDFVVAIRRGRGRGKEPERQVVVVWGRAQFPETLDLADPEASQSLIFLEAVDDFTIPIGQAELSFDGDGLGHLLSAPGDVDLDGYPDFLVAAPTASRFDLLYNGMVYLIYGGPELRTRPSVRRLPELAGELRTSVIVGPYACDVLGRGLLAGAGDFDGDGVPDLAVGAERSEVCDGWDPTFSPRAPRVYVIPGVGLRKDRSFRRGDCDDNGSIDLADAICTLTWLFFGGGPLPGPGCLALLNTNGDESVDLADPVLLLTYLFLGGSAPAEPFFECGAGSLPSDQTLGCVTPPSTCAQQH